MSDIEKEEQSFQLMIQPPATQQKRTANKLLPQSNIKKPPNLDIQLKINVSKSRLDLYLTVNRIYLNRLIQRKQKPPFYEKHTLRNILGTNCLIYKQFSLTQNQSKQLMDLDHKISGNIQVHYYQNLNTQFKIYFDKSNVIRNQDYIWALFHYSSSGIWKSKNISMNEEQKNRVINYTCKIPNDDLQDYLNPSLLVHITLKRKQVSFVKYHGISNLGNTCFMNSCIQLLFYIRPLRKIILQSKSKNPIIFKLKQVFHMLMDFEDTSAIDILNFINSYQKYDVFPRAQQDVQEFLLDFMSQIQKECPETSNLWQGKCNETTYSIQPSKPYSSTQRQNFCQLDVHMVDKDGHYYRTIQESLKYLLLQEQVDQLIENDKYGKINVRKKRTFEQLPDVLFINLKRYEWNKQKMRLSKIFSNIAYSQNINLGFLVDTPGRQDLNSDCQYTLYSVIVHKGTSPHNGHYFVFINVSTKSQQPEWVQFNDSILRQSDVNQILSFTGKKIRQIILDKEAGNFVQKEHQSDASSYLLVYIQKDRFDQYQKIKTTLSQNYIKQKLKKKSQKQRQNKEQVRLILLSQNQQNFNMFDSDLDYMTVPLDKNQFILKSLQSISKQYLGMTNFFAFKVDINNKILIKIDQYDILSCITNHKRNHSTFDYLLIVSTDFNKIGTIKQKQIQDVGIVSIVKNQLEIQLKMPSLFLSTYDGLQNFIKEIQLKGANVNFIQQKKTFMYGWNKYIQIQKLKNYQNYIELEQ